jgi:hypothetical protein
LHRQVGTPSIAAAQEQDVGHAHGLIAALRGRQASLLERYFSSRRIARELK